MLADDSSRVHDVVYQPDSPGLRSGFDASPPDVLASRATGDCGPRFTDFNGDGSLGLIYCRKVDGCWPSMAPDESGLTWVFDGSQTVLRRFADDGSRFWDVNISRSSEVERSPTVPRVYGALPRAQESYCIKSH